MINSPFDILGVPEDASRGQIKASYKKLALKCHPDINSDPDAEEQFKKIQSAYEQAEAIRKGKSAYQQGPKRDGTETYQQKPEFTQDPAADSKDRQAQGFGTGYWERDEENKREITPEEQYSKLLKNLGHIKNKPNADNIYGILTDFEDLVQVYESFEGEIAGDNIGSKATKIWKEKKKAAQHFYDTFFVPEEIVPRIIGTTKDYASIVQSVIQDPRPETVYASLEQAVLDIEKTSAFVGRTGIGPAEDELFQFSFFNANEFVDIVIPALQEIRDTLSLDKELYQKRINDIATSTLEGYRLKFNLALAVRERTGDELYRILFDANNMAEFYFQEFKKVAEFLNLDVEDVGSDLISLMENSSNI